jgi:hypothetical protein
MGEDFDSIVQGQCSLNSPKGIITMGDGNSKYGQNGITDIPFNLSTPLCNISGELSKECIDELAGLLRIQTFHKAGKSADIGMKDGDGSAFITARNGGKRWALCAVERCSTGGTVSRDGSVGGIAGETATGNDRLGATSWRSGWNGGATARAVRGGILELGVAGRTLHHGETPGRS